MTIKDVLKEERERSENLAYGMKGFEKYNDVKGGDFNKLIKLDKNGSDISLAGSTWKQFDYDKGFEALIKKAKKPEYIENAGKNWKQFDYKKGLDVLIKLDKVGYDIVRAGKTWKQFDQEKAMKALRDKDYDFIATAARSWKGFDKEKILKTLEGSHNYELAKKRNFKKK